MPLSKDILGQALYDFRNEFINNKNVDDLIAEFGGLEDARLWACKKEAEIIIKHFVDNIKITIPGTGLIAPSGGGPVTGSSTTGTIL